MYTTLLSSCGSATVTMAQRPMVSSTNAEAKKEEAVPGRPVEAKEDDRDDQ
ncbi:hypothetical protein [Tahibacter amnicola]|uniref:Lipoprotein n=1 Tax=Tahibacter amnicola TaxID=2976241 RepID=A0ABY6B920_9GAMM|nr:hypothetical protein [Tahibacter amnicola]UXI66174.1 hypothetical protein N4264_15605 [Tahibacter amnicola]